MRRELDNLASCPLDEIYAQILTLMTTGGMKGAVIFENQGGSTWSICRIKGLDLRP